MELNSSEVGYFIREASNMCFPKNIITNEEIVLNQNVTKLPLKLFISGSYLSGKKSMLNSLLES